jgi:signal transduction histidine kinase
MMGAMGPLPRTAALGTGNRWIALFVMTRLLATAAAVALLSLHRVTSFDHELIVAVIAYSGLTVLALSRFESLAGRPVVWLLDAAAVLTLIYLSGDWRSPFYILGLTTVILPATNLRFRAAVFWGFAFTLSYLGVAVATGRLDPGDLETAIRLETAATHLLTPIVVALALGYASDVLERLRDERERAEHMAIQAERQRIAWELHDSAKQRIHAAHLLLTAVGAPVEGGRRSDDPLLTQALAELRAATADMETSVAELQSPVDGRPLHEVLRQRAQELDDATPAALRVQGELPPLPPLVAAHAQRIAGEALTNAVRHANARQVEVVLGSDRDTYVITVADDGVGMPEHVRPGAAGLRSMRNRAQTIGARLQVDSGETGKGTTVRLEIPRTNGGSSS